MIAYHCELIVKVFRLLIFDLSFSCQPSNKFIERDCATKCTIIIRREALKWVKLWVNEYGLKLTLTFPCPKAKITSYHHPLLFLITKFRNSFPSLILHISLKKVVMYSLTKKGVCFLAISFFFFWALAPVFQLRLKIT